MNKIVKTSMVAITITFASGTSYSSSNIQINSVGQEIGHSVIDTKNLVSGKKREDDSYNIEIRVLPGDNQTQNHSISFANNESLNKFNIEKGRLLANVKDFTKWEKINRTFDKLSYQFSITSLSLNKVQASLTTTDSVFFRLFCQGTPYELKLESYFDVEDGIEAVSHLYKNNSLISSEFGTTTDLLSSFKRKVEQFL